MDRARWGQPRRGERGAGRRGPGRPSGRAGGRVRASVVGKIALAVVSVLVLSVTGYAWAQYQSLDNGLYKSDALAGEAGSTNGTTNILIMGLDSRLDEDGNPLPANIYDALHAGDSSDGGENANVLMLLHVPAGGGKATSLSIPRDDYVDLPGCPDDQCHGKIKQAYGLAFDAEAKQLAGQTGLSAQQRVQQERDAARKEEINTVRQLLGGVPVDHFVEVTLIAFFQIAQVVQPITVCVNEDTQDSYSGADFHQGDQQINAAQAVAFVRQRRDYVHPKLNFTDLDRERRQQAFIASLAYQLKQGGTFTDPAKLSGILSVARQNIAVDANLDLLSFAQQASSLTGGNITFVTLPIDHFGTDPSGEDVNIVNVAAIQALVHQLIGEGTASASSPSASAPTSTAASGAVSGSASGTVDVVNAGGQNGLGGRMETALAAKGYTQGVVTTYPRHLTHSMIFYGSGESSAASALSSLVGGLTTQADPNVSAGHLRLVLATDFNPPAALSGSGSAAGATSAGSAGSSAGSAGSAAGGAGSGGSTLSAISGGGIPCVK